MSDNRLKILVVTPGEPPQAREIRGGLPAIAVIVGGETEELCPFADTVSIVRGRRGDELRLPFNSEKKGTKYDAPLIMKDTGGRYVSFRLEFDRK